MKDILSDEDLVLNSYDLILSVLVEHDDVVEVGAVLHKLRLLQSIADETFFPVDIQLLVFLRNLCGDDGVEALYLRTPWVILSIFLL